MEPRQCPVCSESFMPTTANQVYCPPTKADRKRKSQAQSRCARRAMNHAWRKAHGVETIPLQAPFVRTFDCAQCGTACVPGENVAPHASKFCGYDCKALWHRLHPIREYSHKRRPLRWRRAKRKLKRAAAGTTGRTWTAGPCAACGVPFVSAWPQAVVCSDLCGRRMVRRAQRAKYGRIDQQRKRARHFGVDYEPISRAKVFERDGYRCHICSGQTLQAAMVPNPRAPTIDHVIPVSRGGHHLYSNVRCACFACNTKKGSGAANDQLLLVG